MAFFFQSPIFARFSLDFFCSIFVPFLLQFSEQSITTEVRKKQKNSEAKNGKRV